MMYSRSQEHEADFQALYLLKRSGYDASSMIKTLSPFVSVISVLMLGNNSL